MTKRSTGGHSGVSPSHHLISYVVSSQPTPRPNKK